MGESEQTSVSAAADISSPVTDGGGGKTELDNLDDIVSELGGAEDSEEIANGEQTGDDSGVVDTASEDVAGQEGESSSDVQAPESWSDADKQFFAQLPPELRQSLARIEGAREQLVRAKTQEAEQARQNMVQIQQWAHANLGEAIKAAQAAVEADFAGINWLELQKTDPAIYLQLDAQRQERLHAVERAMGAYDQFRQHEQAQRAQAYQQRLHAELASAKPAVAALMGKDFDTSKFKTDLAGYLKGIGAPDDHINGMDHSYQLVIATKAMLYDRAEKARADAEKKVAAAPVVQGTKARVETGGKDDTIRSLRASLDRDPYNKDTLVDLLMAQG